ncbi:unnamed protein product [Penicillium viridicatum]
MSFDFTSNNHYVQVGANHGNIYTTAEPRSVRPSQDTLTSNVGGNIDAATTLALAQALSRAQRCLNMVQDKTSEHTQIVGDAERLERLLLDIKDLSPEQWDSLENGVISTVFSLLYCCIMECYELKLTPLAISSLCDQLDACNLTLECVYGAAMMDLNDRRWVSSQQQKVAEAIEQMDNKRAKYWDEMKQPGPAIYHSLALLDLLKGNCVPDRTPRFGGTHVSFGGENRGIQAVEYHGSMGHFTFPL